MTLSEYGRLEPNDIIQKEESEKLTAEIEALK